MQKRSIGTSDLQVGVLGLGCNAFGVSVDARTADQIVGAALECGVTFFDTADSYGLTASEVTLGSALARRRNDVVIATKFGDAVPEAGLEGGASPKWIFKAVEGSLRRLGTDRIDLLQLHFPDPGTPWEDTLRALDRLVSDGKVRQIGCCNLTPAELAQALEVSQAQGLVQFVSAQFELSVVQRAAEQDLLPCCAGLGIGVLPYFPLSQGVLTGKYQRHAPLPVGSRLSRWGDAGLRALDSDRVARAERLADFARTRERSLLELAFGWLLSRPGVCCVPAGATTADQVMANAAALSWQISPEDLAEIERISSGAPET